MSADQSPPLVSVVIPTYNYAHFLGEAIESAQAQAGVSTEIIIVDDGSEDDPAAVVRRYPGLRLIRQENSGLAAARNTGWRNATGHFVVFLDADDRLMPNALRANLQSFVGCRGCGFVYGGYRFIGADGQVRKRATLVEIGPDGFASFLRGNVIGMHATVMYRRDVLEETGGFDPRLRACEDYDLYLRVSRVHPVAFSRDCIAEYRMHGGNMSRDLPFMLDWALAVLDKQRPAIAGRPEYLAAYRDGVRAWRRHYADQQLRRAWRERRPATIRDLARIAWRAPGAVLSVAAGAAARRIVPSR